MNAEIEHKIHAIGLHLDIPEYHAVYSAHDILIDAALAVLAAYDRMKTTDIGFEIGAAVLTLHDLAQRTRDYDH